MKVKVCIRNGNTSSQHFILVNEEENTVLYYAPNNWKTIAGAKRWAKNNGFEIKEGSK